ncbi:hypothetical protein E2C01_028781 [Portunus trituberculatus]|uniref:Uncharacterized protein n=1 Tax=Portunus trituberculatus TaxID=210409 RepID=A0A5B7EPY9_PORTR|nr:hypothetical protein [Portunus trituberculatus]
MYVVVATRGLTLLDSEVVPESSPSRRAGGGRSGREWWGLSSGEAMLRSATSLSSNFRWPVSRPPPRRNHHGGGGILTTPNSVGGGWCSAEYLEQANSVGRRVRQTSDHHNTDREAQRASRLARDHASPRSRNQLLKWEEG